MNIANGYFKDDVEIVRAGNGILSSIGAEENLNSYDGVFGEFYDKVACHPIYNRLMWGYSPRKFKEILLEALSQNHGPVLDAGCGSLAFTYKTYRQFYERPVVFFDQSLKLLRKTEKRLRKANRSENFTIIQANAFDLPFKPESFSTIISMNLLHVLSDLTLFLSSLKHIAQPGCNFLFTTLIRNHRFGDSMIEKWDQAGELYSRSIEDLKEAFAENGMPIQYELTGNIAFIRTVS